MLYKTSPNWMQHAAERQSSRPEQPCFRYVTAEYKMIWAACQNAGGLSTLGQRLCRFEQSRDGLLEDLAAQRVLVVPLHHVLWMPNFQFKTNGDVLEGVRQSVRELGCTIDGTEITCWFCKPNAFLSGERPMQLIEAHSGGVLMAARAERTLIEGRQTPVRPAQVAPFDKKKVVRTCGSGVLSRSLAIDARARNRVGDAELQTSPA